MGQDDHLALYDYVEFATEIAALGWCDPCELRKYNCPSATLTNV